jgi:hypothetical protein
MKTITLFLLLVCIIGCLASYAQEEKPTVRKGLIGITYSGFGSNDVFRKEELIGGPGYLGERFYNLGISYLYPLNRIFDLETGLEYADHKITITPGVSPIHYPSYGAGFSLITIPVGIRVNFLRYFFVNGGLLFDADASQSMPINSQTGLGFNLGLGFKYNFKCGFTAFVNPYTKYHSLVSFSSDKYPQHLLESGIRLGVMYRLK